MTPELFAGRWPAVLLTLALVAFAASPVLADDAVEVADELEQSVNRRVDVNLAGEQDLLVLPQVGPVVARRIIEYRKAVGPFRKVEELLNVKGIGRKTLLRLKPLITLGMPSVEETSAPAPDSGS